MVPSSSSIRAIVVSTKSTGEICDDRINSATSAMESLVKS